jgi:hypothetical protein
MNVPSLLSLLCDVLSTSQLPVIQRLGLYAKMTDLEGDYTFEMRIVHLGDQESLLAGATAGPISVDDRLASIELALNLPPIPFPDFGRYEFQLFANQVYIGRATLNVTKLEQ